MDAQRIRKLKPMLAKYLSEFDDCFSRSEPAQNLRVYVSGQLLDLPRKSIEPMADRAAGGMRQPGTEVKSAECRVKN